MARTMSDDREKDIRDYLKSPQSGVYLSYAVYELDREREVSRRLANALENCKKVLDAAPMSQPYNDFAHVARTFANAALALYREAK